MIFVTVGTTYKFDSLVKEIDAIAPRLKEKVMIQIGNSDYIPKNCGYFRFKSPLIPFFKKARLVIAHGGAGSSYELINMGKKVISVENPNVNDEHQSDLLSKLSEERYVLWCKDVSKIHDAIKLSKRYQFRRYIAPECEIHKKISEFLR